MAERDVDLFVIGAGSGGVRAARIAASYGARVMVAEEYRVGGTCVIRGCVPKKLLVYASRFADEFEDAAGYGWTVPEPTFHWAALISNKDRESARLEAAYTNTLDRNNVALVKSRAVVEDAHTVRLVSSGERVRAETILVATGAWPHMGPHIPGLDHVISSNEAFHLAELPKRIVIQGGGYIAVEFASIFAGLGSEVTLVYRGENILRGFDDDVREHLRNEMRNRGITIICGHTVAAVEKSGDEFVTQLSDRSTIASDKVMFAIGRRPNVMGLGLDKVHVKIHAHGGIDVDEYSRSSVPSIYAVGDVTNRVNLTPVAIREGHAFADRLRQQADAGRSRQCADRGVLRARSRRDRADRDAGARALRPARRLQDDIPADESDAVRPRHAHLHEAPGRRRQRPRDWLPYRGAGCRRAYPGHRHRGEDGRDQGRLRRHHGGAPDRGRGTGEAARKGRELRARGGGIVPACQLPLGGGMMLRSTMRRSSTAAPACLEIAPGS